MQSIALKSHVGADGVLNLSVPLDVSETDLEVLVVVQAVITSATEANNSNGKSIGWPPGFLEKTFGCLADDPIERAPQGEYEVREEFE